MRGMRSALVLGPFALLGACSSGGGGGSPGPAPTNSAPSFTSAATASVTENATAAYQTTATDAQGSAVTFAIAGGADAARFTITSAGALAFAAAPNFERPADADADNVYLVQLQASDGSLSSTLNLQVAVNNSREGIAVRRVATGFSQPVFVAANPRSAQSVFVIEKTGAIYLLDTTSGVRELLHTVGNLSTDGERGLLGMVVLDTAPFEFDVLVTATAPDGAVQVRHIRLRQGAPATSLFVAHSVPHGGASNHNGGWIGRGPDGHIYVAIGDGGGSGDPGNNAQNPNSRLGKILRMRPNPAGGTLYAPAPGNPFLAGGGDPFVFALGLRNPFRASFGPDGRLYIGDVGQGAIEEIDVVRPDQSGLNFGWRLREGTQAFNGTPPAGVTLTDPVTQYAHGTGPTQGRTVIGGYVYRGVIDSLEDKYVFADYVSGNIWTVPAASLVQGSLYPAGSYERRNLDFTPNAGTIDDIVSFGEDGAGNLFIVDIGGEIFMVAAA